MAYRKLLAWSVHFYTATGLIAAAGIAVAIVRGDAASLRQAFLLMFVATVIDTTDGWLARKADVKKYAASFDGRRLDDLIDFHTYTTLPLFLIWRAEILSVGQQWILLLPLLASAYGFCQTQAKTADNYFLGFPSYWNIVAFYLYLLAVPNWLAAAVLLLLAFLTFVPTKYLYTTHGGKFSTTTNLLGTIWGLMLLWILWEWQNTPQWFIVLSLVFPAYYLGCSWWITLRDWRTSKAVASAILSDT